MVRQEAAALYRFVDSLIRRCTEIHEYPVYTKTSEAFLRHIELLGEQTKQFLESFPTSVERDKRTASSKRRKLYSLRAGWDTLHEYLKPALDADTLHVPTSLILTIQDEINRLEGLKDLKFTVFHANQVNYLQLPPGTVKDTADAIADVIGGGAFPPSLGLVGIPYSQSSGFLLNCLITHEMAHVAYQDVYGVDVSTEIDRVLEVMESEVGTLEDRDITLSRDTLERWIEELFCDLFAICLIGPAYSFALIELTGATLLVGSPETTLDPFHSFMEYHPAEVARFHAHLMLLRKLGWWKEVQKMSTGYVKVLTISESKSVDLRIETEIPEPIGDDRFLKCFWDVCAWLMEFVPDRVQASSNAIPAYRRQVDVISEYFREAVVPSTIVIEKRTEYPSPIVLMNAAFRFYLESLPTLIRNVEKENPASVEARSKFAERLELWTLKAIEDCRLLTRSREMNGRHSQI